MGKQPAAVIGVGQTHHRAKREDVSMAGLCREAIDRALADANLGFDDIDAIVVGKAPDLFEGVMMPELFLADSLGAAGKPLLRVHTAGSVGGSTAIVASSLVQAGVHKRVLTVAFEKQSESNAMWALSVPVPFNMPVHAGAGGYFAPHVRSYIRRSEAPTHVGAIVAAKDRQNALKNPYAHLKNKDTTVESVLASQMLWDPIRYDETCPSSDGACALVIADEDTAKASPNPAWIHGTVMRSEATTAAERDQVNPQASRDAAASIWKQAGITNPIEEIDAAEIYVPFSWFEPMWLESLGFAGGGRRLEAHRVGRDRAGREDAGQHERRRALLQPDRRQRHAPLRRGRPAGARRRRRAPGRRRPAGPRPRLRRRVAVLRDVGRRLGAARQLSGSDPVVVGEPGRLLGHVVVEPLGGVVVEGGDPADLVEAALLGHLAQPGDQRATDALAAHVGVGEQVVEVEPALA